MGAKEDNLNLYSEYNKSLRTWLVGFGIGVPAIFIINEKAQDKLTSSENAEFIIYLFLAGAASQILMALINKIVTWCAYYKHETSKEKINKATKFFASLEHCFIIDVISDTVSLFAFGWSIILIIRLFLNA